MGISTISTFGLLWIVPLWTFMCKFLLESCFQFLEVCDPSLLIPSLRCLPDVARVQLCCNTFFEGPWLVGVSVSFWRGWHCSCTYWPQGGANTLKKKKKVGVRRGLVSPVLQAIGKVPYVLHSPRGGAFPPGHLAGTSTLHLILLWLIHIQIPRD